MITSLLKSGKLTQWNILPDMDIKKQVSCAHFYKTHLKSHKFTKNNFSNNYLGKENQIYSPIRTYYEVAAKFEDLRHLGSVFYKQIKSKFTQETFVL